MGLSSRALHARVELRYHVIFVTSLKALRRYWMMNLKIVLFTFTAFHVLISVLFVVKLMNECSSLGLSHVTFS